MEPFLTQCKFRDTSFHYRILFSPFSLFSEHSSPPGLPSCYFHFYSINSTDVTRHILSARGNSAIDLTFDVDKLRNNTLSLLESIYFCNPTQQHGSR